MKSIPPFDPSDPLGPRDPQEAPWAIEQEFTAFRLHHGTHLLPSGAIAPVVLYEMQLSQHSTGTAEPEVVHARLAMSYELAAQLRSALDVLLSGWSKLQGDLGGQALDAPKQ